MPNAPQRAALAVSALTKGTIDVVINNAALVSHVSAFKTLGDYESDPAIYQQEFLDCFNANVLGVVNTASAFLPLLQAGKGKKFINISTGGADLDATNAGTLSAGTPYFTSKAAANLVVAKYNTVYGGGEGKAGILFLSISPGFVSVTSFVDLFPLAYYPLPLHPFYLRVY